MNQLNRRSFVGAASAAGLTFWSGSASAAKAHADVRVALIGLRGRGRDHLQAIGKNITVLCDVDRKMLALRNDEYAEKYGKKLPNYVDYRRLLDEADVDAVAIATPNHTHALIAIAAIQAGKDVYCEKPVSHNVWEGAQIVAAARRYDKIVQCGTQSRSSVQIAQAIDWVNAGNIGKIEHAVGTCYKPRMSIGKLDSPLKIPGYLDYDLWCGPAEKREIYRPKLYYDWHWDTNTGNGDMGNQGIHEMDVARWFLGEHQMPKRVLSIGGRLGYDDAGDTPNTQIAYFDYEKAPLLFETRGLPKSKAAQADWNESMDNYRGSQIGVIVQCEQGYVVVPTYNLAIAYDNDNNEIKRWEGAGNDVHGALPHFENWLEAVVKHDASLLNADIQEGHMSSSLCHIGSISHRLGKPASAAEAAESCQDNDLLSDSFERMASHLRANEVSLDKKDSRLCLGKWIGLNPKGSEVLGDPEATAMLRREGRTPFVIPETV